MKSNRCCRSRRHDIIRWICYVVGFFLIFVYKKSADTNTKSTRFKDVESGLARGEIHGVGEKKQSVADDKDICGTNGNYVHVLLPKKTSVLFCGVAKAASTYTSWFLKSNNISSFVDKDQASQDTFSFMWTREPYSRLYSAYENKLFSPNKFWKQLGIRIIKAVRTIPSKNGLTLGHDVSFAELVKYVTSVPRSLLNPHIRPINESCNPCKQHFDFVGRLESFPSDFGHICSQLQTMNLLHDSQAIKKCQMPLPEVRLSQMITNVFQVLKLNKDILSNDDCHLIIERTWRSFQIRGYVSKNMSFPFTTAKTKHLMFKELYKALNDSIAASKTNTELKLQKRQAMIQAYMSVPTKYMMKLKEFVKEDCQIFGYDEEPAYLFKNRELYKPEYDYFGGTL